ncbi:MAG: nitrogen regulation protein NR(II), partial [Myxococcota bacterium]
TEQSIEQVLFKGKYDYRETLSRFSQDLVSIIQLETLLNKILTTLRDTMEIDKAWAWLYLEGSDRFQLEATVGEDRKPAAELIIHTNDPLIVSLARRPRVLVTEELERFEYNSSARALGASLRRLGCEACIPLYAKSRLIGIITLGRKMEGGIYNEEDLKLLGTLGNEAAIAIENARLYENLKQQQSAVRRAEHLATLGTLTAGLAHEIRNPLVSVKTFLQLLPERLDDEEFRTSFLQITTGEVERITDLLNELLEFARPSDPIYSPEDLPKVVDQMATLAKNEAFKHGVSVTTRYDTDLPQVTVDPKQIKQVVQNLLNNAIQATPKGGTVHLDVRAYHGPEGEPQVQIEVADTGKGIPEEDLENLFTPFFTKRDTGTGLGLAMTHRIVTDHRGKIEVKSQVESGTSFTITLPLDPFSDDGLGPEGE